MVSDSFFQNFTNRLPVIGHLPRDRLFALLILCAGLLASLFISLATPVAFVRLLSAVLLVFWLALLWRFWVGLSLSMACQVASVLRCLFGSRHRFFILFHSWFCLGSK